MRIFNLIQKIKFLVKDGFFHILIGNILVKMVAFLSSIVIVRLVSKSDYGYLAYADNLYQYINLLSGLGLSTAILKFCSPQRDKGINKFFFNNAMYLGVIFQLFVSLMLIFFIYMVDVPFPEARKVVSILVLYPAITQVVTTLQSYIRAQLNNKLYAKIGVIQTLVIFLTSLPMAYYWGIYGVAYSRYLAMLLVAYIGFCFVRKDIPKSVVKVNVSKKEYRLFWETSISMMMANFFSMIMPINEMFLINNYIKNEVISANYKVAILIPSQIVFITNSVAIYLFPKLAQMSNDLKAAFQKTIKAELLLSIIIFITCFLGYFISPILIQIVYGNRYIDSIQLSKIYWIVYGINASFRMLPMNILPAIGATKFNFIVSFVSCIIHALILKNLIIHYGILGAPYSLIIVYSISGCIYWIYLYKKCLFKNLS